ncbi:MAG TPA: toxin-antitoxin system HicB family antitoxin [Thermoanaerobaculia bacterium]|nr:toxin-antitoxin system HicB family antitoxin [Thermoanaerobaculia bacterium]
MPGRWSHHPPKPIGANLGCSGRLLLRLPRSLHRRLAREARRQDVSLNQYLVALLAEGAIRGELGQLNEEVERLRAELAPRAPRSLKA